MKPIIPIEKDTAQYIIPILIISTFASRKIEVDKENSNISIDIEIRRTVRDDNASIALYFCIACGTNETVRENSISNSR